MDTCSYLIPRNEFSRCPEYKLNFAYVSRNARKVERAGLYHAHFRLFRFLKQPSSGSYRLSLSGVQRIHTCVQWYRCFASFVACGPDVATYYIRYSTQRALFFRYRCIQIYIYTHLLTPWCRVLLEKLTGLQLLQKFPTFHATRRFITPLTGVRHLSLSWASPIQSIYPQPTSWRSILILSTHLCLSLPSGLLPYGFPTKTLYTPPSPHPYLVTPRSKYSPQHHFLKHPQLPFLPQCQRPSFTPIQNNRHNYSSIYLDL